MADRENRAVRSILAALGAETELGPLLDRIVRAACGSGLLFEFHQKVHDGAGIRAAVQDISGLDQMSLTAGPIAIAVDECCAL